MKSLYLPMRPMDHCHKTIHIFHFLVLHNRLLLHKDTHMPTLILFRPLPFKKFMILNN